MLKQLEDNIKSQGQKAAKKERKWVDGDQEKITSGSFLRNTTSNLASRVFSKTIFPSREANTMPPELKMERETYTVQFLATDIIS